QQVAAKAPDPAPQPANAPAMHTAPPAGGDGATPQQGAQPAIGHAAAPPAPSGNELRVPAAPGATQAPAFPVPAEAAAEQIAVRIGRSIREGTDRFTIQMKPAELGQVSVRL